MYFEVKQRNFNQQMSAFKNLTKMQFLSSAIVNLIVYMKYALNMWRYNLLI